jgi:carboxyl-terminal processing protease
LKDDNMNGSTFKVTLIAFLVIGGSCLAGGLLVETARAEAKNPEDQLKEFGRVLSLVESQSVGEVATKDLVSDAIHGMLQTLDPHSSYLPPEAFTEMRDEQRGEFSGLGIQIAKRGPDKPLTIIAPIEDTPAQRAGLISGDIISEIEGDDTIDMTVQDAVKLLKGAEGTPVTITVHRPSDGSSFDVTIIRAKIRTESLRLAYMITPITGYIQIINFTSTTTTELDRALAGLAAQGMEQLVLDLRGNPGGLLDQAVQVSERFLEEGQMVVYTRGRIPGADQEYHSGQGGSRVEVPLVVLVDQGSASASEIVSGAIQDQDRGLVVGQTTFGKGLVQRVIPLRNRGALAVTTAKYYTPSGRLIQRDYSDLEEYFYARGHEDNDAPNTTDPDAPAGQSMEEKPLEEREVFRTTSGRKVYGGGGITPDYIVEVDRMPGLVSRMIRDNHIFEFSVKFHAEQPDLKPTFPVGDEVMASFKDYLTSKGFEYEAEEFTEHQDLIALRLKARISFVAWDKVAESRVLAALDPQLQKALAVFNEAAGLAQAAREATPGDGTEDGTRVADLLTEDPS